MSDFNKATSQIIDYCRRVDARWPHVDDDFPAKLRRLEAKHQVKDLLELVERPLLLPVRLPVGHAEYLPHEWPARGDPIEYWAWHWPWPFKKDDAWSDPPTQDPPQP